METKQELIDEEVLGHEPMQVETGLTAPPSHGPSEGDHIVDVEAEPEPDADGEIDVEANTIAAAATYGDADVDADADAEVDEEAGGSAQITVVDADSDDKGDANADISVDAVDEEDLPVTEPEPTRTRSDRRRDRPPPIIIEELDTPATRRAKSMAKKQQRLEALAEQQKLANLEEARAASPEIVASSSKTPVKRRGRGRPRGKGKTLEMIGLQEMEMKSEPDSELSSLSSIVEVVDDKSTKGTEGSQGGEEAVVEADGEIIDEDNRKWKRVSAADAHELGKAMNKGPGELHLRDNEFLEGGTLVWAKVGEHRVRHHCNDSLFTLCD